jgi:hypothetical protein
MQQIILGRCSLRNCQEVFLGHIHCSFYVLCKCVFGDTHHIYLLPMRVTGMMIGKIMMVHLTQYHSCIHGFLMNIHIVNWILNSIMIKF